jgi:mRNA interferase RelE/StbE
MATWRIEWKASAAKELRSLDRQLIPRLLAAISTLSSNPFPAGFKKLHGSEHTYRLRVNDYRIIYEIQPYLVTVQIVRIRHRKDVYR